jgi:hypothetical protein
LIFEGVGAEEARPFLFLDDVVLVDESCDWERVLEEVVDVVEEVEEVEGEEATGVSLGWQIRK